MAQAFDAYKYSARAFANTLKDFYGGDWLRVPFVERVEAYRLLAAENAALRKAGVSEMDAARYTAGEFFALLHRTEFFRSPLLRLEAWSRLRLNGSAAETLKIMRDQHGWITFREREPVLQWATHKLDDWDGAWVITRHERTIPFSMVLRLRRAGYIRPAHSLERRYAISGSGCGALYLVKTFGLAA